jgi:predicted metal-dependent peptidase
MMMREEKKVDYDLDMRIFQLLQDEPFFALLSRQLNKRPTTSVPTAGIKFNKDDACYEIVYNPKFMAGLNPELPLNGKIQEKWVLMHELYHASLGHCTYRNQDKVPHEIQNIGMDMAINSLTNMREHCPKWAIMPGRGKHGTPIGQNFEMASEWYINKLLQDEEENPGKHTGGGSGEGQFDDHEGFGNPGEPGEDGEPGSGDCPEKDIADARLAEAVAKAAQECEYGDPDNEKSQPKGWGNVSQKARKIIKKYANSRKPVLDPKKVLASFIKASVAAEKKTSVTKRNRRLPGKKFGRRVNHRAKIGVSIDQSGSVSDQLLGKVFDWLNEFAKFASFTVIPFDHRVFEEKVYVWQKGQKRKRERVLCGGTDFDAPTEFVNKGNFDGHLVITDMMAGKPKRSNCQRMWLTDESGERWKEAAGTEKVLVLK